MRSALWTECTFPSHIIWRRDHHKIIWRPSTNIPHLCTFHCLLVSKPNPQVKSRLCRQYALVIVTRRRALREHLGLVRKLFWAPKRYLRNHSETTATSQGSPIKSVMVRSVKDQARRLRPWVRVCSGPNLKCCMLKS